MSRGRFTNIPSVDRSWYCASSLIVGSFSLSFCSLYKFPLVLKKRFNGNPLFSCHCFNSSTVGFSSLIGRTSASYPASSTHFSAFLQVVHFHNTISLVSSFSPPNHQYQTQIPTGPSQHPIYHLKDPIRAPISCTHLLSKTAFYRDIPIHLHVGQVNRQSAFPPV